MTRIPAALLAIALAASPAQSADPRVMTVPYEVDRIVPVQGRVGFQSMIEFGNGEKIENVAVGDSAAWQVTPNKRANLLFLKPLMGSARTNMTVVTDQRVYHFDLTVAAAGKTPVYNLRFTYGTPKISAPISGFAQASAPASATASAPALALAPAQQRLNFAWEGEGKKNLLPIRAFDDGRSLYLQFRSGEPLPALFARAPDGLEGPVNFHQSGNYIVVDEVPAVLIMRHGKRTATLSNRQGPTPPLRTAERR